jgi:hypothetical protein
VKAKPDAKATKHAQAELRSDHAPRRLLSEPRLSAADERQVVKAARRRNDADVRTDVAAAMNAIAIELEFVKSRIGKVAPGVDHRDTLRFADRAIKRLREAVQGSTAE